jgi:hypothetical protein
MQIPYPTEQGIISAEQGILAQEQGISPAKPKTSPRDVFGTHRPVSTPSGPFLPSEQKRLR